MWSVYLRNVEACPVLAGWLGMAGMGVEAITNNLYNHGYPFTQKPLDAWQSLGTLWCILLLQRFLHPVRLCPLYYTQENSQVTWFRGLAQGYHKLENGRAGIELLSA